MFNYEDPPSKPLSVSRSARASDTIPFTECSMQVTAVHNKLETYSAALEVP